MLGVSLLLNFLLDTQLSECNKDFEIGLTLSSPHVKSVPAGLAFSLRHWETNFFPLALIQTPSWK